MAKYKRDDLETIVTSLNFLLKDDAKLILNYAPTYGGYCLAYENNSGHHVTERMPVREMYRYLQGALDYVS